jgi:hypothetical protein
VLVAVVVPYRAAHAADQLELVLAIGQLLVGTGLLPGVTLDSRRVSSSMD